MSKPINKAQAAPDREACAHKGQCRVMELPKGSSHRGAIGYRGKIKYNNVYRRLVLTVTVQESETTLPYSSVTFGSFLT